VTFRRQTLWSAGAKVGGLGVAALAAMAVVASLRNLKGVWRDGWATIASNAVAVAFGLLLAAGLLWIAWRLWRRWSAGTARLTTGVAVAWLALHMQHLVGQMVEARAAWVWQVAQTPIFLLAAVAYRKASRAVIRWSELEDPLDAQGQPAGHMQRVRAFCVMFGICVWISASDIAMAMTASKRMHDFQGIAVVASMALGWIVYRVTLWWMTPPTQPALPPGRGFDVLPSKQGTHPID
jgi:hypothetical protein